MTKFFKSGEVRKFLYVSPRRTTCHKAETKKELPICPMNSKTRWLYMIHFDVGGKPGLRKTEYVAKSDVPLEGNS